ncbi:MAG: hypothetical protein A2W91_11975 [Bacteroidetes bacterium GWF2_38_335]|nr:MAG: hypothetical protein A2W91_11975 [Bacteroidetes bacterium GWF2_38_335]OFY76891.1 MAG: hypothetical protein A2281_00090 [Bacteroidetes bacterium RIFOXYA12_FULL_38_20]HBS86739.1 hypothetical protein [Bacteroidales bacterium]
MKRFTLIILALVFVQFTFAQNYLINAPKKMTKGEAVKITPLNQVKDVTDYASAIWYEDCDGAMPAGFTLIDNSTAGNQDWIWTNVGPTGSFATDPIASTTAANGWLLYDSDLYCGADDDAYFVLPEIDLTAYDNVKLTFEQFYRDYYDQTAVEVSNDGATWVEFPVNEEILVNSSTTNPSLVEINISSVAGGMQHVFIRFHFTGACGYNWQVDDIALFELAENDIILDKIYAGFYYTNGGPYSATPVLQRMGVSFGADASNFGFADQTNVLLNVAITDGTSTIFDEVSAVLPTMVTETSDSFGIEAAFIPDEVVADYAAIFNITSDEVEETPDNNLDTLYFSITEYTYARWFYYNSTAMPSNYTGSADGDFVGYSFVVSQLDAVQALSFYVHPSTTEGTTVFAQLYTNDADPALLCESDEYTITLADIENGWVTLDFVDNTGEDLVVDPAVATDYIVGLSCYWGAGDIIFGADNSSFHPFNLTSYLLQADGWGYIERVPMFELHMAGWNNVNETAVASDMNIYPNPASDLTRVSFDLNRESKVTVNVFDFTGKLVFSDFLGNLPAGSRYTEINTTELSSGIYNVQLLTGEGVTTHKLVVSK